MSILIRDMEMPKSCNECILSIEQACGLSGNIVPDYWARLDRPPWCELVELPPHGRLIDADALIFDRCIDTYAAVAAVANAPTIIESEGDE